MSEDKFLRYTVNEGEYVFFYGDEILFFNSKSNPFIYITIEKEGVKKELPLTYCDITRMTAYGYKIKFYNKNCAINVKVNAARNMVFFEFTKLGFFGETISIKDIDHVEQKHIQMDYRAVDMMMSDFYYDQNHLR